MKCSSDLGAESGFSVKLCKRSRCVSAQHYTSFSLKYFGLVTHSKWPPSSESVDSSKDLFHEGLQKISATLKNLQKVFRTDWILFSPLKERINWNCCVWVELIWLGQPHQEAKEKNGKKVMNWPRKTFSLMKSAETDTKHIVVVHACLQMAKWQIFSEATQIWWMYFLQVWEQIVNGIMRVLEWKKLKAAMHLYC